MASQKIPFFIFVKSFHILKKSIKVKLICLVGIIWVKKVYIMLVQQLELNWQLGAKVCEQFHLTTQTMQHAQIYISKYLSIVTFTSLQIIENKLSHAAMKFFFFSPFNYKVWCSQKTFAYIVHWTFSHYYKFKSLNVDMKYNSFIYIDK